MYPPPLHTIHPLHIRSSILGESIITVMSGLVAPNSQKKKLCTESLVLPEFGQPKLDRSISNLMMPYGSIKGFVAQLQADYFWQVKTVVKNTNKVASSSCYGSG